MVMTRKRRQVSRKVRKTRQVRKTKYPRCFDICMASQKIYDLAKKLKATKNPFVKALVAHHSAILCVEKAVSRNKKSCNAQRKKLAKFAKLKPTAKWSAIFLKLHKNMAAVSKKIAKLLTPAQVKVFTELQSTFEKIHFKAIARICRK